MHGRAIVVCFVVCVVSAFSEDVSDWDAIKPIDEQERPAVPVYIAKDDPAYRALHEKLEKMRAPTRSSGQTLFSGDTLIFDSAAQRIELKGDVEVFDDRGSLHASRLSGQFTDDRVLELISANQAICELRDEGIGIKADQTEYNHEDKQLYLTGKAVVTQQATGNQMAGERIKIWMDVPRRIECGPHARLLVVDSSGMTLEGMAPLGDAASVKGVTDIRADHMVYDEKEGRIDLLGSVWLLNPQISLDCGKAHLALGASNALVSVQASESVLLRSAGREVRADTVIYDHRRSEVQLEGNAAVQQGSNRLRGDRIQLWLQGSRTLYCGPNAELVVQDVQGFGLQGESTADEPVDVWVRSDQLMLDESERLAVFEGGVRLREARGSLDCEKVRLHFKEENEIDWIEAETSVIIHSGDRKAIADKAIYDVDEGKMVLEGSPKLKQGQSIVSGERITFWQHSMRMVCEPNARALFFPDEETRQKFLRDMKD